MLSTEEQAYLDKRPMRRLTFDGLNDLYLHPLYGARTIADCIGMEQLRSARPTPVRRAEIPVSDELMSRHLDCVDRHGCGLF